MSVDRGIVVSELSRVYQPDVKALDGLSFQVAPGSITALLGPNGAGKTTAVRILTTLLRPTSGKAEVAGFDVVKDAREVRRVIGVTMQASLLDPLMTGRESTAFQAALYGLRPSDWRPQAESLLGQFDLSDAANRPVGGWSGGMKRRLELVLALLHGPKVLFLDEPTAGLDPISRSIMLSEVQELRRAGVTILLTTQYIEEADQLADAVVIIDKGRLVAKGIPSAMKEEMGTGGIVVETDLNAVARARDVLAIFGEVQPSAPHVAAVKCRSMTVLANVVRALDQSEVPVHSIDVVKPTLEEVFLHTLRGTAAESRANDAGASS